MSIKFWEWNQELNTVYKFWENHKEQERYELINFEMKEEILYIECSAMCKEMAISDHNCYEIIYQSCKSLIPYWISRWKDVICYWRNVNCLLWDIHYIEMETITFTMICWPEYITRELKLVYN